MYSLWGMLNVMFPQFGSGHLELKKFFHPRNPVTHSLELLSPAEIPEQKEANLFESNTLRRHRQIPKEEGEREQTSSRSKPQQDQKGGAQLWKIPVTLGASRGHQSFPISRSEVQRIRIQGKIYWDSLSGSFTHQTRLQKPSLLCKWLDQGTHVKAQLKGCCWVVRWGFYTHRDMPEEN